MKNIFRGIGIAMTIFSIFFFLLAVDKMIYHSNEKIYDFYLEKSISSKELGKIAKKEDVTVRLVEYKNTSFARNEINVSFLNPKDNIKFGLQKSVFPKNRIYYTMIKTNKSDKKIQTFTIMNNDSRKIEKVNEVLKDYGVSIMEAEPLVMKFTMMLSAPNLRFFVCLTILLILSISTYYVYRLKEIGILKLQGWSTIRISIRFLYYMYGQVVFSGLIFAIPFMVYILLMDPEIIFNYVKLYFYLIIFLSIVFVLSSLFGMIFIENIDKVSAIKNNKNNKVIFAILIGLKVFITIFLIFSLNLSLGNILNLNATTKSLNNVGRYNFYSIHTSVKLEDELEKSLIRCIEKLDEQNIYNYSPPYFDTLNILELKSNSEKKKSLEKEPKIVKMSHNMLTYISIYDLNGEKITMEELNSDENILLVPEKYKKSVKEVKNKLNVEDNVKVLPIKDKQIQIDLINPGRFIYNAVYYIHPVKKVLYLNSGEVLLNLKGAKKIKNDMLDLYIDNNSVRVDTIKANYDKIRSNKELELIENSISLFLNMVSFMLCIVSMTIIFLELRKKEFAVYKLLGEFPNEIVLKYNLFNAFITIMVSLFINPVFIIFTLLEIILYNRFIIKYYNQEVVLALRGN